MQYAIDYDNFQQYLCYPSLLWKRRYSFFSNHDVLLWLEFVNLIIFSLEIIKIFKQWFTQGLFPIGFRYNRSYSQKSLKCGTES